MAAPKDVEALVALLGREVDAEQMIQDPKMISRRILITKPELNGKTLAELRVRSTSGVTITRINRSGIDLVAAGNLQLQLGDRVIGRGPLNCRWPMPNGFSATRSNGSTIPT